MKAKPKVALVIVNALSRHNAEIWGNLYMSRLSGELAREKVYNDIFLLLMRDWEPDANRKTISEFIRRVKRGKYNIVIHDHLWLSDIKEKLEREAPGIIVAQRDYAAGLPKEIEAGLYRTGNPFEGGKFHFAPNFDYIQLGAEEKMEQRIIDCVDFTCPYKKNLEGNRFFKNLPPDERRGYAGCSYCIAPELETPLSHEEMKKIFLEQFKYFHDHIPSLEKLAMPCPENFFQILADLAPEIASGAFRPIKFYMQLRPDVLVERETEIRGALERFEGACFALFPAVAGFENFSSRELTALNRGYAPKTNFRALKVFKKLKADFPGTFDASSTIASFILFNPYTRVKDLELNLKEFAVFDFAPFADININRARLSPNAGLYALAKKDGLIPNRTGGEAKLAELPRCGFSLGDIEYAFKDTKVSRIHAAYMEAEKNLSGRFRKMDKVYALEKIVGAFK